MAAPSPALSPVLTAIVAPLHGLSWGMFGVTMRARPVPTSATVVEVPTVRMNITSSTALKPAKLRTLAMKVRSTITVPHRPGTAVRIASEPARSTGGLGRGARPLPVRPAPGMLPPAARAESICLLRRRCRTI